MAGLLALAAFVRFRGIRFGLPHTQARPDETAIIDPVRVLLSGHLPHFYDYPWLFLWIVAIAYVGYFLWGAATGAFPSMSAMLASWPVHWEPFFLIPRAISAVAGTASVLIVFRLGRQVRDDATAIVSALFFTFVFMHVQGSHFGTTDVVMTGLIVAAVALLIDAHRTRQPRPVRRRRSRRRARRSDEIQRGDPRGADAREPPAARVGRAGTSPRRVARHGNPVLQHSVCARVRRSACRSSCSTADRSSTRCTSSRMRSAWAMYGWIWATDGSIT